MIFPKNKKYNFYKMLILKTLFEVKFILCCDIKLLFRRVLSENKKSYVSFFQKNKKAFFNTILKIAFMNILGQLHY